jgi:prepilin-type N-terminal cleavage/methylation domain-containing protein
LKRLPDSSSQPSGFTLVEVLIAMLLVALVASGVAQLFVVAAISTENARRQSSATTLAVQKLEALRSLTWALAPASGVLITDTTTDLTTDPSSSSGVGLRPSPAGALATNTPGYVDYLDARGRWVGTGSSLPRGVVYIRRWSVEPLPADPDTLLLQVLVTTARRDAQAAAIGGIRRRLPDEALVATIRTRKVALS